MTSQIDDPRTRSSETLHRARMSAERAAYAAIGAPVVAIKTMNSRVGALRESVRESRRSLIADLGTEVERWASTGEGIVEKAVGNLPEELTDEVLAKVKREVAGSNTPIRETDEPVTTINGIGPNYADQLKAEGVVGIRDFLTRTATSEDLAKLAESTGFSSGTIESWRNQVDLARIEGVGGSYQQLLHRGGVWTISQLAATDPDELTPILTAAKPADMPTQTPSIYSVKKWVGEAKELVTANGAATA